MAFRDSDSCEKEGGEIDMKPIKIRGLRQNNLKNISLDIPKNQIVVFTGVSGSGKSSIVFDTIAAESQRQMNETYTAWIRGRLPKYEKPNVKSRKYFDYILTAGCIIEGSLNGSIKQELATIYDNGITIFHGDYTSTLEYPTEENIERSLL